MEADKMMDDERKYLLLICHDYQAVPRIISHEEKINLNGDNVDMRLDFTTGKGFIRPPNGRIITNPVFGPEAWALVDDLITRGGEAIRLDSATYMAARIYRLRKLFRDNNGHFFVTQRHPYYAIRLNPERTWQIITELGPNQE